MKKYLLLVCCLAHMTDALAQGQFGLKISPGLSYSRVYTDPDTAAFSSDGLRFSLKLGPMYDYVIKDNYYINTGLFFVFKSFSIKNDRLKIREQHELQYLQIPLLLKLYANEVALDTQIYVELGPIWAIKVNERISKMALDRTFIKKMRLGEISGLLGCGIEYHLGLFTSVFMGISYQIGLRSLIGQQDEVVYPAPVLGYQDCIDMSIGMKF